ncbi:MAG: lysine biosynthesis protein LysW [Gemmatimonadetes bacterium]|jgi:alpha-aminoadipate/glutamate carrier protein LysW|nr:lysine biosynthesis protein LysW [Gemmatimonadota bacterium]
MPVLTTIECPVCWGGVNVSADVMLSELLDCGDCGAELEVTALSPALQLAEAPMSAEDWGE